MGADSPPCAPLNLSILVTSTDRGGTPTRLRDLALELTARGWAVEVISVLPSGVVAAELRSRGVPVVNLEMTSSRRLLPALRKLRRHLREHRPDVLQTALYHANVLGRVASRGLGIAVVSGYQSVDDDMPWARRVIDRSTAPRAQRHIAVSQAVADRIAERARIPRDRIDVIPIGKAVTDPVDATGARKRLGIPAEAKVVGFVGRLHPVKDLPTLLQAVRLVPSDPWLVAVGDGPDRPLLEGLSRVVAVGEQADVTPYLSAVDVFVLPSRWEGMPGALVEAMALGLPVVATRVGGVPEVITDGVDGLLVEPGDVTSMAAAIEVALNRPDLGRAARDTVQRRFSVDGFVDAHVQAFESGRAQFARQDRRRRRLRRAMRSPRRGDGGER